MAPGRPVAVVTGGAVGLGRAITLALAGRGWTVAFTYLTSATEAAETLAHATDQAGSLHAFRSDVADWDATEALVAEIERTLGPIAILVNNAGTTSYAREAFELTRERWDHVLAVNLGGAFGCVRAVGQRMAQRGGGSIVNVASIAGITGRGSSLAYVVSKAALLTMTTVLARDLAPNVRVNAVAPGTMPTDWYERHYPVEARPHASEMTPVASVVEAVLSLIDNDALTGQVLVVDSGESLGASRALDGA